MELFIFDMELIPGTEVSGDPALTWEFGKLCSGAVSLKEAYAIAAKFVQDELVDLRKDKLAERVVSDLLAAAQNPDGAPEILQNWR